MSSLNLTNIFFSCSWSVDDTKVPTHAPVIFAVVWMQRQLQIAALNLFQSTANHSPVLSWSNLYLLSHPSMTIGSFYGTWHERCSCVVWGGLWRQMRALHRKKETLENSKERQLLPYFGDKYMTTEWRLWETLLQSVCQWDKSQWFWTIERNTIWTTEVMWQTKPFIINFLFFRSKKQMIWNSALCWHQQCFWTRANPEKEPKTL